MRFVAKLAQEFRHEFHGKRHPHWIVVVDLHVLVADFVGPLAAHYGRSGGSAARLSVVLREFDPLRRQFGEERCRQGDVGGMVACGVYR